MVVINIYGVPGSQKSKFLSSMYSVLACNDKDCSIIGDFNVDLTKNMFSITGEIVDRLDRAKHSDMVVMNTPILLQAIYYRQMDLPEPDMFEIIAYKLYQRYTNVNVLIEDPSNSYLYRDIKDMLNKYGIEYETVKSITDSHYATLLNEYFRSCESL